MYMLLAYEEMHSNVRALPYLYNKKNGSHYRASELIQSIFGDFKNQIERRGGQNNRPINLPKV